MAIVPGVLTINWTSNYVGPHRVCYRIVGAPSYICTIPGAGPGTDPICPGNGGACTYDINLLVDNETCDPVDYEGYVQAACEDVSSLVGRVTFAAQFVPSPACKRWAVTCVDSPMDGLTIDTPLNAGYTSGFYPALPVIGGGGTLATVDVTVTGGVIDTVAINVAGSGYTGSGTVDISSIPFAPGIATTITVEPLGCTALDVYDCTDATTETIALGVIKPGEVYDMCGSVEPTVPVDYTIVENGNCLCNCTEINLTEDGGGTGDIDYIYLDCNSVAVSGNIPTGGSLSTCMVTGSLSYVLNGDAAATVTTGAACSGET